MLKNKAITTYFVVIAYPSVDIIVMSTIFSTKPGLLLKYSARNINYANTNMAGLNNHMSEPILKG